MNRISLFTACMAVAALPLALASCGDDDDYTPGAEVSADCPNVYFPSSSKEALYLYPEDVSASQGGQMSSSIKMVRADSVGELTVPVVVDTKSDNVTVAESVTFLDGDTLAYLSVSYTNPEQGVEATFHVADGYYNPYLKKDGSAYFRLSVSVLEKVCDVTYSSAQKTSGVNRSYFAQEKSEIYHCMGQNQFIWKNLFGSGMDVTFEVVMEGGSKFDSDSLSNTIGQINFLDHVLDYYGYGYVFLMDDDGGWLTWTPAGQTVEISSFYMYDYHYTVYANSSVGYSFIDFKPRTDEWYAGYIAEGLSLDGGMSWTSDGNSYVYFFFSNFSPDFK